MSQQSPLRGAWRDDARRQSNGRGRGRGQSVPRAAAHAPTENSLPECDESTSQQVLPPGSAEKWKFCGWNDRLLVFVSR